MTQLMGMLERLLKEDRRVQAGPTPIRISNLTSPSFAVEMFAYVLTPDIDAFYKIEAELFLQINELVTTSGVERV